MANTQTRVSGTVVGYFENYSDAQEAVSRLKDAGFQANQIGLAARTNDATATGYSGSTSASTTGSTTGSRVSSAAHEAGAKTEGMWEKVKNFFEGGAVEPYADERGRGDLASREITTTGSGSSSGYEDAYGAGSNDFRNTLSGLSVPEQHSRYFGHRFENSQNGAVVTVNAQGREAEAERILEDAGADLGANAADYDYSAASSNTTSNANVSENQRIQLLGEVLRVHKERVNRGEVRIGKQVVTEQQQVQVPVSREEIVIERVPVAGTEQVQGTIGDSSDIRIPLTEERASLDKQTVVREEVAVGKRTIEGTRTVGGEVRHEELVVDDQSKASSDVNATDTPTNTTDRNFNR